MSGKQIFSGKNMTRIILAGCIILSLAACIKTIFISLDIDESYAVALSYRLASGDRLFRELWESHQMSGVYLAPLIWLFLKVSGTTTGLVIYTRIAGSCIHFLIGLFLVSTFQKKLPKWSIWLLFFLHMNFLPKWVQTPEFELLQYWFILLLFLCLYRYFGGTGKKKIWLFMGGICLFAQFLLYPTLVILYPVYSIGIVVCDREKGAGRRECINHWLWFTVGAVLPGLIFLAGIFRYLTWNELLKNIGYIMQDESHTLVSTAVKWKIYLAELEEIILHILPYALISFFIVFGMQKWNKQHGKKEETGKDLFMFDFSVLMIILLSLAQIAGCLFGNQNQFYMLWRYIAFSFCGVFLYWFLRRMKKKSGIDEKLIFCFALLPGFITALAVLIITNMDVNTTAAKMYICVLGLFLLMNNYLKEVQQRQKKKNNILFKTAFLLVLMSLFVGKLIEMRITGCGKITVLAPMKMIENGPARGIYMISDTADILNEDYTVLKNRLTSKDRLLYVGSENLIYLWTDAQIATPSTQGTNAYNQEFIEYFKEYPEKYPTVIAVDKQLGVNPVYYNSSKNYILFNWIEKDFHYKKVVETEYLKLYIR